MQLTPELVRTFNEQVLSGLPLPTNVIPGAIRTYPVGVGSYPGAPAEDCEYLLARLCEFLNHERSQASELDETSVSVLLAVMAHLYIAWIHPFGDGNGRTARLVEFMLLLHGGVPAPAAHLLSNHYSTTRQRYYEELDRASRSGGDVLPFLQYAIQGLRDGLRSQLGEIRSLQLRLVWRDFVTQKLEAQRAGQSAEVRARRRELVLALSEQAEPVPVGQIGQLSVAMATAFSPKTRKTLARDLNYLARLGLIELSGGKARVRMEQVTAFLPPRRRSQQ